MNYEWALTGPNSPAYTVTLDTFFLQNAASQWLMHYLKVLTVDCALIDTKINTAQHKISLVDALKSSGVLTLRQSRPVFLVVPRTLGLFLGMKQGIQSCLDICDQVLLQVVTRRVLSVLANGHHIKLPSTSVHVQEILPYTARPK